MFVCVCMHVCMYVYACMYIHICTGPSPRICLKTPFGPLKTQARAESELRILPWHVGRLQEMLREEKRILLQDSESGSESCSRSSPMPVDMAEAAEVSSLSLI